ncbi:CRISPR-associated helicase Cas3' [Nocardioides sp. NPDC057577]|uniref:CRISPR-associated helicase Cas3' n=1 Tax=Nocardioides sp. NPDC057577 TaxID=3346171 RepID=UPI00366FC97C
MSDSVDSGLDAVPKRPLSTHTTLFAHTPSHSDASRWHLWRDHAQGVGDLAAGFGAGFGASNLCRLLGLTHDAGKLAEDVQGALMQRALDGGGSLGTPHKVEGAALAALLLDAGQVGAAQVMALANFGHHHGVPNRLDPKKVDPILRFMDRNRSHLDELTAKVEAETGTDLRHLAKGSSLPHWVVGAGEAELFTRMCHSALVDADFLDTAAHFDGAATPWQSKTLGMTILRDTFVQSYRTRFAGSADSELGRVRWEYFDAACRVGAADPPGTGGIYRLPAPTGCGKTMSAAAFALTHAAEHGKRRVVVVVPFTSITTQNADVYREILSDLGDDVVLEHHSNIVDDEVADSGWRRLAATNWDAEFIVTTTVQLLESLFANRPSATRKLHRLVNSVVVIDEVQSLPLALIPAILRMMRELSEHFGVTFLLASATQPAFWAFEEWREVPMVDVMPTDYVPAVTQRVSYDVRERQQPWSEIAEEVAEAAQVLVIVNTTADAQQLHGLIKSRADHGARVLHLSTRMYSSHRAATLATAKSLLRSGASVILVSTQLIEAGVDIDFPVVYRALAPADSVVQSAGRCNREGRLGSAGRVIVFQPEGARIPQGEYANATQVTESMFVRGRGTGLAVFGDPASMERYYRRLYALHHDQTVSTLSTEINSLREKLAFDDTARRFQLIGDHSMSVVVTDGAAAEVAERVANLIDELRVPGRILNRTERRLLNTVTATAPHWWRAKHGEMFESLDAGPVLWLGDYDPECGLVLDSPGEATIW